MQIQEISLTHKKTIFYFENDQTQWGYGVSILQDIHNPTEHSPGQPALADSVLSRGVGLKYFQMSTLTSASLQS